MYKEFFIKITFSLFICFLFLLFSKKILKLENSISTLMKIFDRNLNISKRDANILSGKLHKNCENDNLLNLIEHRIDFNTNYINLLEGKLNSMENTLNSMENTLNSMGNKFIKRKERKKKNKKEIKENTKQIKENIKNIDQE